MERVERTDRKIALIGASGSGKSRLAAEYAEKTGCTVFDTDAEFTRRFGGISEFFDKRGESEFRKFESELIVEGAASNCGIVACGGGAPINRRAMNALRVSCDIVRLRVPFGVAEERIKNSDRPLKADFRRLAAERERLYSKYADYTIDGENNAYESLVKALRSPRPNRYDVILCDADDTLLDFQAAMRSAVTALAREFGVSAPSDRLTEVFKAITDDLWGRLERNEITVSLLDGMRFSAFNGAFGITADPLEVNARFVEEMKKTRNVIEGATEFLDRLRARGIKAYIITNGLSRIARERLKPILSHADGAFISEDVGFFKPDIRYFAAVHSRIGSPDKDRILVFGDSPSSDIAGGAAFGADTCLFAVTGEKRSDADYSVADYASLERIL